MLFIITAFFVMGPDSRVALANVGQELIDKEGLEWPRYVGSLNYCLFSYFYSILQILIILNS